MGHLQSRASEAPRQAPSASSLPRPPSLNSGLRPARPAALPLLLPKPAIVRYLSYGQESLRDRATPKLRDHTWDTSNLGHPMRPGKHPRQALSPEPPSLNSGLRPARPAALPLLLPKPAIVRYLSYGQESLRDRATPKLRDHTWDTYFRHGYASVQGTLNFSANIFELAIC